ncbi:hypothetical protein HYU06_03200 [Candidatus Woesearchaeota archaeon]|nr:hypothetical protein [Candidatus Woesearchaeota archaeon]
MKNETSLTLKFRGIESQILNNMIDRGLFNTKSEAIRSALVHYSLELGFFDKQKLWQEIQLYPKRKVSAKQLAEDIDKIKNEI